MAPFGASAYLRGMKRARIAALIALPFALVAGYLGWKVYHQMTTPLAVYVMQEGR